MIWLLARGHTIADVAAVTSFVPRWIEQLLARYNAHGPEALGDLCRRNGSAPSVLRPELLARLPERLATPPSDGEIEIGVLKGQCLDRRIDDRVELEREIAAWQRRRNAAGARVKWMFTTEKARAKMGRAYPKPAAKLDQPANQS